MTVRMENSTSRLVTVVLNSGTVVHLPPGQAIETEPVEIENNAKVRKLRDSLAIAVTEQDNGAEEVAPPAEESEEVARLADEPDDLKPTSTRRRKPSA